MAVRKTEIMRTIEEINAPSDVGPPVSQIEYLVRAHSAFPCPHCKYAFDGREMFLQHLELFHSREIHGGNPTPVGWEGSWGNLLDASVTQAPRPVFKPFSIAKYLGVDSKRLVKIYYEITNCVFITLSLCVCIHIQI